MVIYRNSMAQVRQIYIRQMRYEEARAKLLQEIEMAFADGIEILEIVHGIGSYTLAQMVKRECQKIPYLVLKEDLFYFNPGSVRYEVLIPHKDKLKTYLEKERTCSR